MSQFSVEHIIEHYKQPLARCQALEPVHIYNNFVKAATIQTFLSHNAYVFDMGCGRGGDIKKYAKNSVGFYYGIDLVPERVEEASKRYKNLRVLFSAWFDVGNFMEPIKVESQYDFVSCQFAFHYAWSSKEKVYQVMKNAINIMKDDAYFYLTFPDFEIIRQRLVTMINSPCDDYNYSGQNINGDFVYRIGGPNYYLEFCSIYSFEEFLHQIECNPYGQKYTYYMKGAVNGLEEYLVHPAEFESICDELNLQVYFSSNFLTFEHDIRPFNDVCELKSRMRVMDLLTDECQSIVELYKNVVITKNKKRRRKSF
jgi:mRNA (guanine-N7-)-methyltransferase